MKLLLILAISFLCVNAETVNIVETFQNPILEYNSQDPQALYHEGYYYLVLSSNDYPYVNGGILLLKSKTLTDFRGAQSKMVYHLPSGNSNLWAPELHSLRGNLYIYFSMNDGNIGNRMYVIRADDPNDIMESNWIGPARLYPTDQVDYFAIDGTPMQHISGLYFIWSGWASETNTTHNLYITSMCDPMSLCGPRVQLNSPTEQWEGGMLTAPYILRRGGQTFLTFSGGSTWDSSYCVGFMGIDSMLDPMQPSNWWRYKLGSVFSSNATENVYGPGHASFVNSPDGLETWILYHASDNEQQWRRLARVQKMEWTEINLPIFPHPSGFSQSLSVPSGQIQETYTNPIIDTLSADPMVLRIGNYYYFVISTNGERELTLLKSRYLTDFRNAEEVSVIYSAPAEHSNCWASEMHMIDGQLYLYFTQDRIGESHRMYVIQADDPSNPMGSWGSPIRIMPELDIFSIDGTVLEYGDGNLYYIFCSVDDGVPMSLYIAPMCDPLTVCGPRVLLRSPSSEWDTHGGPVNEGPFIVQNANRTFLIFSGSSTWNPNYCLGMMGIDDMKDPMIRANWWDDIDHCVFYKNEEEDIYCTGHAAFTTSPDGTELWMLYHATNDPNSNESSTRIARTDRIEWAADKAPVFPRPTNRPKPVPSGQPPVLKK